MFIFIKHPHFISHLPENKEQIVLFLFLLIKAKQFVSSQNNKVLHCSLSHIDFSPAWYQKWRLEFRIFICEGGLFNNNIDQPLDISYTQQQALLCPFLQLILVPLFPCSLAIRFSNIYTALHPGIPPRRGFIIQHFRVLLNKLHSRYVGIHNECPLRS